MDKIITDSEVINYIVKSDEPNYAFWFGAGTSVEAGVHSAQTICEMLRDELVRAVPGVDANDKSQVEQWAREALAWDEPEERYLKCIEKAHAARDMRGDFFRSLTRNARPSFCHHAAALLMSRGHVKRTCLTTNFDSLIESAFLLQGIPGCQALRSDNELSYWISEREHRYFVIKLHGDVDTLNTRNTLAETLSISEDMEGAVQEVVSRAGLVVLGSAGNEKSVRKLFEELEQKVGTRSKPLSYGLLWGVYMGPVRPSRISDDDLKRKVRERIRATGIHKDIVGIIERATQQPFAFFPIWGAGNFMLDLVRAAGDREMSQAAGQYLDHEMRLRSVFAGRLTEEAVERHLDSLRQQQQKISELAGRGGGAPSVGPETVITAAAGDAPVEVRVIYGDITDTAQMAAEEFRKVRRAVVSPEDTCVSAGGGVAYMLLKKADPKIILNELAKFSPIEHDTVAVTSGGNLPVHYILHAAAVEIDRDANYQITEEDVSKTMRAVLRVASTLRLGALWVPLLGAGVGSLGPTRSLEGILDAVAAWDDKGLPTTIMIFIFRERELTRQDAFASLQKKLGARFTLQRP